MRKEIFQHKQGNDSISDHNYATLKALWDELSSYTTLPHYTCGAVNDLHINYTTDCLMEFFNDLDESYAQVRSQILLTDPLPTVE